MRDQFDSGEKTKFTEDDNPHDVAALFKEYFRDLPEPLLTRDLYSAFLETQSKLLHNHRETVYVYRLDAKYEVSRWLNTGQVLSFCVLS